MARFAVLLRGVNVGGNNKVPMTLFREALTTAAFGDVKTLLASGNVVLSADLAEPASVALSVKAVIASTFGLDIGCLAVSGSQVQACLESNPLWEASYDGSRMFTTLSDTEPEVIDVPRGGRARLNDGGVVVTSAGEVHVVHQWCPEGISKTPPLSEFVRYPKGAVFTGRNRNTLEKMLNLF